MDSLIDWLPQSARYDVLLGAFLTLVVMRFVQMGYRYAFVPGGLFTALVGLFTASDIISLASDNPNFWPTSFFVDPYELREWPLLCLTGSMLLFWLGESLVFPRKALLRPRASRSTGVDRQMRVLGRVIVVGALIAQGSLFLILGVSSMANFFARNGDYGFKMGSEGLSIFTVGFNLFPVGLALAQDPSDEENGRVFRSLVPAALAAGAGFFLTASKAGAVTFLFEFLLATYWRMGRLPGWAKKPAVILSGVAVAAASLALKTQIKYAGSLNDTSTEGLVGSFNTGAIRFQGGTFQTYCVILREFGERKMSFGGAFNAAAFTNTIPRVLWPAKPLSPISYMMSYLGGGNDPSGAAITAQGAYFVDWGTAGLFIGMLLSGVFYGLMNRIGMGRDFLQFRTWLSFTMVLTVASFYECGFIGVVPTAIGTCALWCAYRIVTSYFVNNQVARSSNGRQRGSPPLRSADPVGGE